MKTLSLLILRVMKLQVHGGYQCLGVWNSDGTLGLLILSDMLLTAHSGFVIYVQKAFEGLSSPETKGCPYPSS